MPALPDRRSSAACVRNGAAKMRLDQSVTARATSFSERASGDDGDDLVRPHTGRAARIAETLHEPADQRLQHLVADVAPERIVDVLEAIDVEHRERETALTPGRPFEVTCQPLQQQRAIRKAGERVVVGEIVEALGLDDVIERKGHLARKLTQQLRLGFIEEAGLRRVEHEHTCCLAVDDERQDDRRAMPGAHEIGAEPQLALDGHDVVAHDRPPQHHGFVHEAAAADERIIGAGWPSRFDMWGSSPAHAMGVHVRASASVRPIQAKRNLPCSTAMRHASSNRRSRS